jgi:mRNA-degrading endonuclease YafQ of YafQ-DinJ toxin-antitoxin module
VIRRYKTTPSFRKALSKLLRSQKDSAKKAFVLFKRDPFDPRLRTHKIHQLSAFYKKTIYAVKIEDDLRSIFYIDGENIISLDIGTHAIYRS